jgi:hypothetical protein
MIMVNKTTLNPEFKTDLFTLEKEQSYKQIVDGYGQSAIQRRICHLQQQLADLSKSEVSSGFEIVDGEIQKPVDWSEEEWIDFWDSQEYS